MYSFVSYKVFKLITNYSVDKYDQGIFLYFI